MSIPKKVAIQGIKGSFHDMVAHKFFGDNIEPVECKTFKMECDLLTRGEVDYMVMAIENTIAGSLLANYALLREYHLRIIGEVYFHIQMSLLALPGVTIENLEFVHSHPIAIRQCADYLDELSHVKIIQKNDTAESAKYIKANNMKNTAAIAHAKVGDMYGLEVLEKGIETNKRNYTRFLILDTKGIDSQKNNKASICFELGHQVGALAEVLNIMTKYSLNLTKIQSVPIVGKPYEYSFHVDLEWNKQDNYENAIHAILKYVSNLSILGEYPKGELNLNGNTLDNHL